MSLADHVGIILSASLDQPRAGKANPNKPDFYVQVAYPPSATDFLLEEMKAQSPTGALRGMKHSVGPNSELAKPFAGIPNDWIIVRFGTGPDYPPELFGLGGEQIPALPINRTQIGSEFFAGQNVRLNGYARYWKHESGSQGISWSLKGVMAVGGGERRSAPKGEPSESAFAQYRGDAKPAQQSAPHEQVAQQPAQQSSGGNPFQQGNAGTANPFG